MVQRKALSFLQEKYARSVKINLIRLSLLHLREKKCTINQLSSHNTYLLKKCSNKTEIDGGELCGAPSLERKPILTFFSQK